MQKQQDDPRAAMTGRTVHEAAPHWPRRPRPKADAPNIVWVVLDDCGFAQLGCYGASTETPAIDALASRGLRYTNFHVTAMCSPTRTCLLTGRNHHAAGMGYLADFDTGFDNARGAISARAATLAEMLREGGYGTYALGKWHLVPPAECSPVGPFDNWPTQRGFNRYYGFLGGEDDQWAPELWYDQHHVPPPSREGYHLSEDLVDRAQEFLSDHLSATPDNPFFLYLAFGACHAPHQAPQSFLDKYRGRFDAGWDAERDKVLARQKQMGIVPPDTALAPRNPGVRAWDTLSADERRLVARMQEVFAGFTEHTDAQIGRLVEFLQKRDKLRDTLFVVLSDNGASGEGGEFGSVNEYRYFLGLPDSLEENLAEIDKLGGPWTHNHYPAAWAQAGNTPLKFYKKYTFGGGVRAPLIVHWPAALGEAGLRTQFHHAIDLAPTMLDLAGVPALAVYRGVEQLPVHGTSIAYSFADPEAASTRETQYFEMGGQRGIYHRGWKAVTHHRSGDDYDADRWELYDLQSDYSETVDRAADEPERLREMIALWWREAEAFHVMPLDDRAQARAFARDPATDGRLHFRLYPGTRLLTPVTGPNFALRPFRIRARIDRAATSEEGVLLAYGRRAAGFSLFIQHNRLCFDYNLAGRHTVVSADGALPTGAHVLGCEVTIEKDGARAVLTLDDQPLASAVLPMAFPAGFGLLSTQCGLNSPSPVSDRYEAPFRFEGTLDRVDIELGQANGEAIAGLWEAAVRSQ
ncbi:arylsulfatase [Variovorax sp. PBL-E5]|uniref:arylsulfatase n=1 Tax=Variovorax sp. PBL-E5 TaxID=434014 RepID=UPI001316058F|nr:arylsulfatase [Variovorax sp. PBL-E5]VTU26824.1 Arylsulfatase [Variovorax sp. PBL-E5]